MFMKIACCISGQPRYIPYGCQSLRTALGSHFPNIDFFLHSWYDPATVGESWDTSQPWNYGLMGAQLKHADKFLVNFFKPINHIIEPQINFDWASSYKSGANAVQSSIVSMYYSIWKANELKKEHEQANNFIYDMVIRTRYDMIYFNEIPIDSIAGDCNGAVFLPEFFHRTRPQPNSFCDYLNISSSPIIDIISDVFNQYPILNTQSRYPYADVMLGTHVKNHNITIHTMPVELEIAHKLVHATFKFDKDLSLQYFFKDD